MSEIKSRTRIIRAQHDENNPYFSMCRNTAQDGRLSLEATGTLTYLLSKPGDWELQPSDIGNRGQCGRNRVYRILKELRDAGYVARTYVRNKAGHITDIIYEVYEQPFPRFQEMDNQEMGYQEMENGHITEYREEQSTESTEKMVCTTYTPEGDSGARNPAMPDEQEPDAVKPKARKPWPMRDAVCQTFRIPPEAEAEALDIVQMLMGRSKRGEWKRANLLTPATPEEVIAFGEWWDGRNARADKKMNMVREPAKIQREFEIFRSQRKAGHVVIPLDNGNARPSERVRPDDAAGVIAELMTFGKGAPDGGYYSLWGEPVVYELVDAPHPLVLPGKKWALLVYPINGTGIRHDRAIRFEEYIAETIA